ncbi:MULTISPECIES: endospore germination permease [Paenibacillus]|uniref:GerAB/ArcD/ProY family transporter n=1 Tax=Paenibacillus TaxID=44249 RepID=UPI0002661191|nr:MULTISPECIES: endospore germination permease [Paenibacillus]AJE52000.1 spore gernimation protein [Paenibacillus polymyxa]AZH31592.1 spore gernimation protein [Paenibacillus sp. M-152]MBU9706308.1 endospore germination permease [Paenibacillus sp. AK121]MEE4567498.1 endospore germination permease [Paenibacillus polymyxa]QOH64186.1 spore gernimation protein [Paenibacillus polymyxa]
MKQFTTRQIVLLGILMEVGITLIHAPAQAADHANQHAYWTCVIAAIVLCLPIWAMLRLKRRFPDQDLMQAMVSSHPVLGRLLLAIYLILFLIIFARDLRIITDLVEVVLLPLTPIVVVSLIVLLTMVFMVKGGMSTLINMTEIFVPLLIVTLLTMPLFFGGNMDFSMLRPYLHPEVDGVIKGSWRMLGYMADIMIVPFVISGKSYNGRSAWFGHLLGTAILIMLVLLSELVIGVPILSRLFYPSYELVRQLQLTDFLDRFDLFVAALTVPTFLTKIGVDLYVTSLAVKRMFAHVWGSLMVWPVGLLGYVCSFMLFSNIVQIYDFSREWTAVMVIFFVFMPFLLWMLLRPKFKGSGNDDKSSSGRERDRSDQKEGQQESETGHTHL